MRKFVEFLHEIGTIMYVGGILSHIVIGAAIGHPDASTAFHVYQYKEISAYILILPGLGIKVLADLTLYFGYNVRANWLKVKLAMAAFLTINAFVFLVPMMPEMLRLAKESLPAGVVSAEFIAREHTEALIGMSNVIPLVLEILMGAFRPKLFGERRSLIND
ncbi:MAG: enoyl-CoA hydratase [Marinosulfonomonas sp.]|nr:enoyl-CoA hydratase [Marinosulfonomonas sp.]